ncbi:MAG: hypothetical protein MI923_20355, partial [Phycisphaerales bacterium]|nr:hypothetical protein [Phycisphaerales bacterium]
DPLAPSNGVMAMKTHAEDRESASSVAAHGAFARAGEDEILVTFLYRFCGHPTDELVVYLSDAPEVSTNLVEVARVYPPISGPGSIGSSEWAEFRGLFPRGDLNFLRGTYVELELRGEDACILIDDFDPFVCTSCGCGDFTSDIACGAIDSRDFNYLASQAGTTVNQYNLCADLMDGDNYIDDIDMLVWSANAHDPNALSLCSDPNGSATGTTTPTPVPNDGVLIAGLPHDASLGEQLYPVDFATGMSEAVAGPSIPAPVDNLGVRSGHGVLIQDNSGSLYQLHGAFGLVNLELGERVLAPRVFPNVTVSGLSGATVRVGRTSTGGYAFWDAAFDPMDSTNQSVFIMPVEVDPVDSGPYRAAARVELTGNGDFVLREVFGKDPAIGSTMVPSCEGCYNMVFEPDASRLRELAVDAHGNLFIVSGQQVNDNDYLLIFPRTTSACGGECHGEEIRYSLTGLVEGPRALAVLDDFLYVSTSRSASGATDTLVHRFHIERGGAANSATGVSDHTTIPVPGVRFLTSMIPGSVSGELIALGFNSTACPQAECPEDNSCLGCNFILGDPLFMVPRLATIAHADAEAPVVATLDITNTDLAMPLGLVMITSQCGSGDFDGNGLDAADIPRFVEILLNASNVVNYDGDVNGDSRIDGRDIQGFMGMLLDGGAVVTDIPLFVEAVLHPADS